MILTHTWICCEFFVCNGFVDSFIQAEVQKYLEFLTKFLVHFVLFKMITYWKLNLTGALLSYEQTLQT